MPQLKINIVRLFAIFAMATCCALSSQAQSPQFSEPWVEGPPYLGFDEAPTPLVAVSAELLWLGRTEADGDQAIVNGTLTETINNVVIATDQTLIAMDDLNLPTEAGIRFSVLLGPPTGRYFEFTYAGIFDQDAQVTVTPNAAIQTMTSFFGFTYTLVPPGTLQHTASYESDLHSLEMNMWTDQEWWRLRPFVGLRWIRQTEEFRVFENQAPEFFGQADYSNNLYGAQMGFATVLWQRAGWFHVQAVSKAGVYHNDMDFNSVFDFGGALVGPVSRELTSTSCSGQIDVTAVWQLTPYFNFHVGYTGLWLTEVGLVGDQNDNIDITTGTGDIELGGISYQGGHFGVTIVW